MKLTGLMPVRNEEWCLGLSLRVALLWCDEIVILLHECIDGSADIVESVIRENERGRIHVLRESGEWAEMVHRQRMLEHAREKGATHIAICDADEVLSGGVILPRADNAMIELPLYYMRGSITRCHANGIWGNRRTSVVFEDHPNFSWNYGDTFHRREPKGLIFDGPYGFAHCRPVEHGDGGILHLWALTERQIKAKSALYKITERLRFPRRPIADIERMYNWAIYGDPQEPRYGTPDTWTYADVPVSWWAPYMELATKHLNIDAEPWQVRECERLIANHGRATFAGLDLFGVA